MSMFAKSCEIYLAHVAPERYLRIFVLAFVQSYLLGKYKLL